MDCGPTCLRMVAKHYGKDYSLEYLRDNSFLTREGVSLLGISEAAEKIGLRTLAVKIPLQKLVDEAPLPCILHWNQNHFVVLYKISNSKSLIQNPKFYIADPGVGKIELSKEAFLKSWIGNNTEGVALLLETIPAFYNSKSIIQNSSSKKGFGFLIQYLRPYKKFIAQLFLSMLIGSGLTLIFPFLTQTLVDNGINHKNVPFVILILVAQITLFFSSMFVELIRGWIMLHINSRINILIISDFLMKLMRLPISYFDSKLVGDLQQRIGDHDRIQSFLTGSVLTTLFSLVNLVIFTFVLATYSTTILAIFFLFSVLGIAWILLFLRRRKKLDYVRFQRMSDNQNVLYEMITSMQEIKLNNCETKKRWAWENVQAKIFTLNIKSLSLGQTQQVGSVFFNQLKNIIISYISAREVMNGNMTMGMMMSVSYIIGQLNSPIENILGFVQSAQDAKISLDRLSEIHNKEDEDYLIKNDGLGIMDEGSEIMNDELRLTDEKNTIQNQQFKIQNQKSIIFTNVCYQYQGPNSPYALKNINLHIPEGKVTAIVGASGSGKTTLVKMLLQFYPPTHGTISVSQNDLQSIVPKVWRSKCGTVMQEGYIFSDTIANNIAVSDENASQSKLQHAVHVANIQKFIEELPLGYNTKIGLSGTGISTGQKQRMLIARAVYKNPDYLFFDEATSALDANNEKIIIENLQTFFENKTVVVVAHRLSTVKNADQIVLLDQGEVKEIGTHAELVQLKGMYYELIKNQLELGN
jgi:ATP-binding cassette, subfamily B, bacterial